jgi:tetratricopeptide (TPR) repeat protein
VTRLERFMQAQKIKPIDLARVSGYTRQYLLRLRQGIMDPSRECIVAIVDAASSLSGSAVRPEELFVLSGDSLWEKQQAKLSRAQAAEQKRLRVEAEDLVAGLEARQVPFAKWMGAIEAAGGPSLAIATALYERGRALTFENPQAAERIHRVAVAVADRLPRDRAALSIHGRAHMGRGNALGNIGDYPSAFDAFDAAEAVLTKSPQCIRELAEVWYSRARTHARQTAYQEATHWVRRARMIFDGTCDDRMGAVARLLEGGVLYETGSPAEAEQILRATLDPLEHARDRASLAFAYLAIGRCNIDLGEAKVARTWLERARAVFLKLRMRSEVVRAEWSLGWLRALHEDATGGLEQLYEARRNFEELAMPTDAALVGLDIVEALLLKEPDGAAARAAQVCRSIIDTFQRCGETASARRAIAHLREAVQRDAADQSVVGEVRQYLKRWSNDPRVVFAPTVTTTNDERHHG